MGRRAAWKGKNTLTNKERYAVLCAQEPSICVYDQPWWLDAVCGADNWDVLLYEKGGDILGALPCYIKKKLGLRYITQPPFTQHNGAWIKYPAQQVESKRISWEREVLDALMDQVEHLGVCHYQQSFSPSLTNWLPLYWRGYVQTTHYTYRLPDIHDPEALFSAFQHNKRKNINKALKQGFQIGFDLPAEQFYAHHKSSLAKQGQTISYSLEEFQRMYDAAYQNNGGRTIWLRDGDGVLLCALFNLWDRQWGYDLISAIDPSSRNTGAPDLLVYRMLEYLSDKVRGYDFEGSMIEGVEESFRHFGAAQTPYFSIYKTYSRNVLLRAAIAKKLQ